MHLVVNTRFARRWPQEDSYLGWGGDSGEILLTGKWRGRNSGVVCPKFQESDRRDVLRTPREEVTGGGREELDFSTPELACERAEGMEVRRR